MGRGCLFWLLVSVVLSECLPGDLVERGAQEMVEQFRQAERLLGGLESTAERALGFGAYSYAD